MGCLAPSPFQWELPLHQVGQGRVEGPDLVSEGAEQVGADPGSEAPSWGRYPGLCLALSALGGARPRGPPLNSRVSSWGQCRLITAQNFPGTLCGRTGPASSGPTMPLPSHLLPALVLLLGKSFVSLLKQDEGLWLLSLPSVWQ